MRQVRLYNCSKFPGGNSPPSYISSRVADFSNGEETYVHAAESFVARIEYYPGNGSVAIKEETSFFPTVLGRESYSCFEHGNKTTVCTISFLVSLSFHLLDLQFKRLDGRPTPWHIFPGERPKDRKP